MLENKENVNVNLTGKEYLDVLKYREQNGFFAKLNKLSSETKIWLKVVAMVGLVFGIVIVITFLVMGATSVSKPAPPFDITNFLLICIGFAWMLHGFGFIIIRR